MTTEPQANGADPVIPTSNEHQELMVAFTHVLQSLNAVLMLMGVPKEARLQLCGNVPIELQVSNIQVPKPLVRSS